MYTNYTVRKERNIHTSVTNIWDILTKPEFNEIWLGTKIETNWEVGSPIYFFFGLQHPKDYIEKGYIVELDYYKVFSYSYWSSIYGLPDEPDNYSVITFELHPTEESIKLILLHHNIHNDKVYEHYDKVWEDSMDMIKKIAESVEVLH